METGLETYTSAYRLLSNNILPDKVKEAENILKECTLCPRRYKVNRTSGGLGFCRTGDKPFV